MVAASVWHRFGMGSSGCRYLLRSVSALLAFAACAFAAQGQATWLGSVPAFPLADPAGVGGLAIHQRSSALQPFTVAGECGAIVGQGDGSFEAWAWPVKLLSHLRIAAQVKNYTVPIEVNDQSAEIDVQPDHTTITFAHAAFTLREILFPTQCGHEGEPGVVALFQVSSTRPLALTLSFTPELKRMWPAPNYNAPSPEWVPAAVSGNGAAGGYYLLHTDSDDLAGAVAMPGTQPGILAPYQERPKDFPLQLILQYDPARDGDRYFPLLMTAATTKGTATKAALQSALAALGSTVQAQYQATAAYYRHFFDHRTFSETSDPRFDQALRWAEISIDQLRVRHASEQNGDETALVAGLYNSGDSNRPGFGWFFGRDSLYTLYAIDSYGDFTLTREELDFLLKRQRADGKIMHEFSQTAELVDWAHTPYEYAAADATPLLLMVAADYAMRSDDMAWLGRHWPEIEKAWQFERTHDSDGDGIYDNAQGTGWVESWPPVMPRQEVYLAALDVQASQAYAKLAALAGKSDDGASARAKAIAATLEREYAAGSDYAFSYNGPDRLDKTATIYPAVAWWDGGFSLTSEAMFRRWASHEFSTDWGTRDVGEHEPVYEPISYHQGSVWPLFTGWASLAEYRTGRSLAGYTHLMENVNLTWAQDLGAVTELLSGQFFEPLGRSTTHQLWSSAMVLSPALRGLFGVSFDAATNTLRVAPQLPAAWPGATLRHVSTGAGKEVTLTFRRAGRELEVGMQPEGNAVSPQLIGPAGGSHTQAGVLHIPLPGVELGLPAQLPLPGAQTAQLKVLEQHTSARSATWLLEAKRGSAYTLFLRLNGPVTAHAEGADLDSTPTVLEDAPLQGNALLHPRQPVTRQEKGSAIQSLSLRFPPGEGYTQQTVTVRW